VVIYYADDGPMTKASRRDWLGYSLVAGVALLAIAGIALLGSYFIYARRAPDALPILAPTHSVQPGSVAPDLAVLTLAGEDDARIIRAARSAGEMETAFATLAYSTLIPDSSRAGEWLLLAADLAERDPARAASAYRTVMDLASLAPSLGDQSRVDLSLRAAEGFSALGQGALGRLAVGQAEQIARHGLSLLPAQRRLALTQVIEVLGKMGERDAAQLLRSQLTSASQGPGVEVSPALNRLPELRGSIVLPSEVAVAIADRQAAAAALAARWLAADEPERAELTATLGAALEAEDAARIRAYESLGELSPADRLAMLHDRIAWLTIKYRAARGGYGVSLVPAWDAQADSLAQELEQTYMDLVNGYGQQVDTLEADALDQARVDLLRQALLWSRLGLFPGDVEPALAAQLQDASAQLRERMGDVGLTITPSDSSGVRLYILAGPEGPASEQAATSDAG